MSRQTERQLHLAVQKSCAKLITSPDAAELRDASVAGLQEVLRLFKTKYNLKNIFNGTQYLKMFSKCKCLALAILPTDLQNSLTRICKQLTFYYIKSDALHQYFCLVF